MAESKKQRIKMLIMDVDGTLTDGKIYIGEKGEMMKAFNVKDGYAISEMLPAHGIVPVIITGRSSPIVSARALEIGVKLVFQGVKDKLELLKKITSENDIILSEIAYIGDDVNDLDCVKACGLGGCPADAADEVRISADYIAENPGGSGAVREFCEYVIRG